MSEFDIFKNCKQGNHEWRTLQGWVIECDVCGVKVYGEYLRLEKENTELRQQKLNDINKFEAALKEVGLTPDISPLNIVYMYNEQAAELEGLKSLSTLKQWTESDGHVIWWKLPMVEPPYIGNPLCDDWPGYHTHWTPVAIPNEPQSEVQG